MYSTTIGRFTSEDPAEDDLNLYRYVQNNPINREDPSGLQEGMSGETVRSVTKAQLREYLNIIGQIPREHQDERLQLLAGY